VASDSVRQRILDAALDIVEAQGIKALTQPRVAKAAGLRQSHLTYYFPRKADLVVALLQASHDRASRKRGARAGKESFDDAMKLLKKLMFDPARMRFFLGIIVEASEEPELRAIVAEHARGLTQEVAARFGRDGNDQAVIAFVDLLRGIGLRMLLERNRQEAEELDLEALAASLGLYRSAS
jgi:DNA-binding transcriptional regulator YbjK